ncbi:Mitochondrial fission protein ELM1 [Glycine soja]
MFGNFTGQKIYLFTFICLLNNYQILIVKELGNNPKVYIWDGQEPNPQMGHLAWADAFVVTTDSVNMISEACSTGGSTLTVVQTLVSIRTKCSVPYALIIIK